MARVTSRLAFARSRSPVSVIRQTADLRKSSLDFEVALNTYLEVPVGTDIGVLLVEQVLELDHMPGQLNVTRRVVREGEQLGTIDAALVLW